MGTTGPVDVTLIVHRYERRRMLNHVDSMQTGKYLVLTLLTELRRRGEVGRVIVTDASGAAETPAAILHVNTTVIAPTYLSLAASFGLCLNRTVANISKNHISDLAADASWEGPVIVKSNLNYFGRPEQRLNRTALNAGHPEPYPGLKIMDDYIVLPSVHDVAQEHLDDPGIVVQRFIPEPDDRGYALRHWIFCGDEGYCNRFVSPDPLVKGPNVIDKTPVPVPEEVEQIRRELGFDYGKFDFVVHDGVSTLLDANRTPGPLPATGGDVESRVAMLADGLSRLLHGGSR